MPKTEMLINYAPGEECRIAVIEDGKLEEFYQERASLESHVGNIYKGRVTNVEPAIQAAFIDFGLERNGFLHISDVHPMYFPGSHKEETEVVGLKTPRRERPPIQKCLHRGQDILVQVIKEGIGTKGPTLTSYLSIPGRFLVMMPNMERLGVSRKIEDDDARREMRKLLDELNPPDGFGFIIRTAGIGRPKTDLKRDLAYLTRLWKAIDTRRAELKGVGELYTESDLLIRTLRDVFTTEIERVIVDEPSAARRARDFLAVASPRAVSRVALYRDPVPLFHRWSVEPQIENINARTVPLASGGSLVIDSTEALVAIDVNSGKYRETRDADSTAFRTNQEAADEACRQLRLRDLGGVVVIDLIDMRLQSHRRDIETRFKENLKRDRARTRTLPISQFGILEMTRQRMRPSIQKSTSAECLACGGAGRVKTPESVVLDVMRRLALVMHRPAVASVELTVSPDVAFQLLNRKRAQLVEIEKAHGKLVMVRVTGGGRIDVIEITCLDERGAVVNAGGMSAMPEPKLEPVDTSDLHLEDEPEIDEVEELTQTDEPTESIPAEISGEEPLISADGRPPEPSDITHVKAVDAKPTAAAPAGGRRRRRRGGRGRGRGPGKEGGKAQPIPPAVSIAAPAAMTMTTPATGLEPHAPTHQPVLERTQPIDEFTPSAADSDDIDGNTVAGFREPHSAPEASGNIKGQHRPPRQQSHPHRPVRHQPARPAPHRPNQPRPVPSGQSPVREGQGQGAQGQAGQGGQVPSKRRRRRGGKRHRNRGRGGGGSVVGGPVAGTSGAGGGGGGTGGTSHGQQGLSPSAPPVHLPPPVPQTPLIPRRLPPALPLPSLSRGYTNRNVQRRDDDDSDY